MLPSKVERSRNSRPVAHSTNRQAASVSRARVFMTTDHVQRFGRRVAGRAERRQRVRDLADELGGRRVLEVGDVVVGVDHEAVAAAGEVERELVPALLGPVRSDQRRGARRRNPRSPAPTRARRAPQRPSTKSEPPYDQSWVAKPVYIVCQASVPRWPKPRTPPAVSRRSSARPRSTRPTSSAPRRRRARAPQARRRGCTTRSSRGSRAAAPRRAGRRSGRSSGCSAAAARRSRPRRSRRPRARGTRRAAATKPAARCSQTSTGPDM